MTKDDLRIEMLAWLQLPPIEELSHKENQELTITALVDIGLIKDDKFAVRFMPAMAKLLNNQ